MAELSDQLSGERLELRRWAPEHLAESLETIRASFDELHLWMSWAAEPPTIDSQRVVIEKSMRKFDENSRWEYGLFERDTAMCVGGAGLRRGDVPDELEIGYWVRTDRTGRGYACEATRVLTTAAFAAPLEIARVRISMDAANHASAKVPHKLGFHFEGEMNRDLRTPAQTGKGILWTVTREQWSTRRDD